jgi:hypothetical protein
MEAAVADPSEVAHGRVVPVDPDLDPRWDSFAQITPGATPFHLSGWLAALEVESGQPSIALAYEQADGNLAGILPLQRTRGVPFGLGAAGLRARLSSLPRTPIAGPVATSETASRELLRAALQRATASHLQLQLKLESARLDGQLPGLEATPWRESYVKALPADPDDLRFGSSRNHARIRWAVAKARREGLTVREASTEGDLRDWFRLYLDVNRWRGLPSRPYRLFETAWKRLRRSGSVRLLLVEHEQRKGRALVAGALLLMAGGTVHYAFSGRRRDALSMRPNDLLQWTAMRTAAADGYRWYDFGEVEEGNQGLAAFKGKWDTEAHRLVRYHLPPLPEQEAGYGELDADRAWRQLALVAWRHVPLGLTALVGDGVYRFL